MSETSRKQQAQRPSARGAIARCDVPESVSLTVDAKAVETLLRKATKTAPIEVTVPELSWTGKALIQEVQKHPWKGSIYHISFFSVQ
jgi:large subunit ribosomal protein L25